MVPQPGLNWLAWIMFAKLRPHMILVGSPKNHAGIHNSSDCWVFSRLWKWCLIFSWTQKPEWNRNAGSLEPGIRLQSWVTVMYICFLPNRKAPVCFWLFVSTLEYVNTQAFMSEAMGRSRRGRRWAKQNCLNVTWCFWEIQSFFYAAPVNLPTWQGHHDSSWFEGNMQNHAYRRLVHHSRL